MVDADHLPFTLTIQQQINSSLSRSYMKVIDALAELGAKEIARRNAIKGAKGTPAVDNTSGGLPDGWRG
jgi:hypothetical protein